METYLTGTYSRTCIEGKEPKWIGCKVLHAIWIDPALGNKFLSIFPPQILAALGKQRTKYQRYITRDVNWALVALGIYTRHRQHAWVIRLPPVGRDRCK